MTIFVGTAGWAIPRDAAGAFAAEGSVLERYATCFRSVEINSSFYRSHRASTWARWADSVPDDFRFSVKIPKLITHERRLVACEDALEAFVTEVGFLRHKLSVLLVQLPPSLPFSQGPAEAFFGALRSRTSARIACEPRHLSWFDCAADTLLTSCEVARVAADPSLSPEAATPGGWRGFSYWRLHGSPAMYRSSYGQDRVDDFASLIAGESRSGADAWCIFDNTASGAATIDALALAGTLA